MGPFTGPARGAAALCFTIIAGLGLAAPAGAGGTNAAPAEAPVLAYSPSEGRQTLASVLVFGNDWYGIPLGDRYDRWRTGHVRGSLLRGEAWTGALPDRPFELMEYRFRVEIIAPDNLGVPAPGDRLYAPSIWLGATTHFDLRGLDAAVGGDIVMAGPQTGIMPLHSQLHQLFDNNPIDLSADDRLDNGVFLDAHAELSRGVRLGFGEVRPFVEVRAGVETLARAGVDVTIGTLGQDGLRLRDQVTGQRVAALNGLETLGGWSVVVGADAAWVADSVWLPEDRGPAPEAFRHRVRAGVNYGVGDSNFFYGVTYLSEEFEGQPEGQVAGTISVDLRF